MHLLLQQMELSQLLRIMMATTSVSVAVMVACRTGQLLEYRTTPMVSISQAVQVQAAIDLLLQSIRNDRQDMETVF